ncbi:MAG TPA: hypothetical protein VFN35_23710 [Ktedonobacteraceae bacterium]|nr:hypothetical protein [Ktedonobacteraceae bacterium]
MKDPQPGFSMPSLNGEQTILPTSEETAPLVEVTEMSLDDVMLLWDGQTSEFNSELRNRPETNCYGYWQKKLAEKQREKEASDTSIN